MPSYKLTYSLAGGEAGKTTLNAKLTQSGVSKNFAMVVPIYADFGNGWARLGSATMVGDSSVDLTNIQLPSMPKKVAVAPLDDVLAEKIENVKE